MKQVVKLFTGYSSCVDANINQFLKEHPDYTIDKITYSSGNSDRVLIVFNVKEPTHSRAVGITYFGGNNNG